MKKAFIVLGLALASLTAKAEVSCIATCVIGDSNTKALSTTAPTLREAAANLVKQCSDLAVFTRDGRTYSHSTMLVTTVVKPHAVSPVLTGDFDLRKACR
jgi:hypothetical protein